MTAGRRWAPVVGLAVVAGLIAAGSAGRSVAGPPARARSGSLSVDSAVAVCPNLAGLPVSPTVVDIAAVPPSAATTRAPSVAITTARLTGKAAGSTTVPTRPITRVQSTTVAQTGVVQATGPGAGGVVVEQSRLIPGGIYRGLMSAPCVAPATDTWLTGADGRVGYTDTLVIANPGTTVANVTVTAWASTGRLTPPKLQAFTVAARSAQFLNIADYTPDAALVSLHVHANSGRVTAEVFDRRVTGVRPAGIDWIPPTSPPTTDLVVPGFPAGTGPRQIVIANPGAVDAMVSLRLATGSGNFSPAGHPTVLVRGGRTALVDLTTSLGGAAGAVVLHSDMPITVAGVSQATATGKLPDIQWLVASSGLTGPAVLPDNSPPFGHDVRVYLTAPQAAAQVRIEAVTSGKIVTVSVAAGRTLAYDPVAVFGSAAYGPLLLTPIGGGPVHASRMLYAFGAHGPLTTAEQPTVLPTPTALPPVVEDPRAAVP